MLRRLLLLAPLALLAALAMPGEVQAQGERPRHAQRADTEAGRADAAAEALFRLNDCLIFLAALGLFHIYGIEQAAVDACLTAGAVVRIDLSLVAAFLVNSIDGNTSHVCRDVTHAAIATTLTAGINPGQCRAVGPHMEQS